MGLLQPVADVIPPAPPCPFPYGTLESYAWWEVQHAASIAKMNAIYKSQEDRERLLKRIFYGHQMDWCNLRCLTCGIGERDYIQQGFDRGGRDQPICPGATEASLAEAIAKAEAEDLEPDVVVGSGRKGGMC